MLRSVHAFKDDEAVDAAAYRRVMRSGYISSAATLHGAARSFGIELDTETFERWKRICAAAGLIDDFLDRSPDIVSAMHTYEAVLVAGGQNLEYQPLPEWADERLVPAIRLLMASVERLAEQDLARLTYSALAIGRIAVCKSEESDLTNYRDLLKQEAAHTSNLVASSASASVRLERSFDEFTACCERVFELATLYDHARDLKEDYRQGLTRVRPTIGRRMALGMRALRPFGQFVSSGDCVRVAPAAIIDRLRYSLVPTKMLPR